MNDHDVDWNGVGMKLLNHEERCWLRETLSLRAQKKNESIRRAALRIASRSPGAIFSYSQSSEKSDNYSNSAHRYARIHVNVCVYCRYIRFRQ